MQKQVPSWILWVILAGLGYVLTLGCCGFFIPGVDILFFLVFGWIWFLIRVLPQLHVRSDMLASSAIYLIAFLAGAHYFLRWLHREMTGADTAANAPSTPRNWRFAATASVLGIVLFMFLIGMSAIGIAHQSAWLIRSPEPIYTRRHHQAERAKCILNLKNIAAAFITYANTHDGRYPDDFQELLVSSGITPAILVCPASNDVVMDGMTPRQISAGLAEPGHCSYLYFAKGLTSTAPNDTVLVAERLENHGGKGINVLYNDYRVEWLNAEAATKLLATLGGKAAASAQTQPTTQP